MQKLGVYAVAIYVVLGLVGCVVGLNEDIKGKYQEVNQDPVDLLGYVTSGSERTFRNYYMWIAALVCSALMSAGLQIMVYLPQWIVAGVNMLKEQNQAQN